eukprot:6160167-Amphidinium_carterae.1
MKTRQAFGKPTVRTEIFTMESGREEGDSEDEEQGTSHTEGEYKGLLSLAPAGSKHAATAATVLLSVLLVHNLTLTQATLTFCTAAACCGGAAAVALF